jgi:antitoxin CcdA
MRAQKKDIAMRNEAPAVRKAANLSIDADLLAEAKALSVNISRAAEGGIAEAVKAEKERRWREENREAIESWNAWVQVNGLPLAKYRQF